MSKVEEFIVQLCKEMEATVVNKKIKKFENKKNKKNHGRLCAQFAN